MPSKGSGLINGYTIGAGVGLLGFVIMVIGLILFATAPNNETKLWYGLSFCTTRDEIGASTSKTWIGINTPYNTLSFCPPTTSESPYSIGAPPTYINGSYETQTFLVEKNVGFNGREFMPIIWRAGEVPLIEFYLEDASGKRVFTQDVISLLNDDTAAEQLTRQLQSTQSRRSLMKAGFGGGRTYSYRSRRAGGSRCGSIGCGSMRRTYYGGNRLTGAVVSGTVITAYYRQGYRPSNGEYITANSKRTVCQDTSNGCDYEVDNDFTREEFPQHQFSTETLQFPLTLTVTRVLAKSPPQHILLTTPSVPEVYITFWTPTLSPTYVAGLKVLVPIGVLLMIPFSCIIGFAFHYIMKRKLSYL